MHILIVFFFSSRRRHTRWTGDWSSDVCSSDLRTIRSIRIEGHAVSIAANTATPPNPADPGDAYDPACERDMGPFGTRYLAPALQQARAGPRAQPADAGRPPPGLRRLPARAAPARRSLGVALAQVAGLPAACRRGRGTPHADRGLAARRDRTGRDRLCGRPRTHRHRPGLPGHPRRRPEHRGRRVRARALRPVRGRDARPAPLRRPVARRTLTVSFTISNGSFSAK